MGGVDESTSDANGLRVSGSLGGKGVELGKMKEAFVLKCQGALILVLLVQVLMVTLVLLG